MGFKCGIVGLPNVGKSTIFKALTKAQVDAANYPFCTIEPNVGIVSVPDTRIQQLVDIVKPQKTITATMEFVDIAGLVEGASKGEGLGNKFLANIRETDAIAHVVRCFDDPDITHVAGKVDPLADIETINTELLLADLETVDKAIISIGKQAKSGNKDAIADKELLNQLKIHLDSGTSAFSFTESQLPVIQQLHLLTNKPTMFIANVDEASIKTGNAWVLKLKEYAKANKAEVVMLCAAIEAELSELEVDEKQEFLQDLGLETPGLDKVINCGYSLLGLHTYFTAGEKEVRAWTIPIGASAPQAAGKIHTDFEKGFIRAEVIGFDDYINHRGESGAKDAGKWRLEGKEYKVADGDVIHFRFNV